MTQTKDFITYTPESIKILGDETVLSHLYDPKFSPIIQALSEKPLTVKEITKQYNTKVDKKDKKEELTIYKYLRILQKKDINLVTKAGLRVEAGKTSTIILYGRTAKIFYPVYPLSVSIDDWDDFFNDEVLAKAAKLLELYTNKTVNPKKLAKFIHKVYTSNQNELLNFINQNIEFVAKSFSGYTTIDTESIFRILETVLIQLNKEFFESELNSCFSTGD